jgi:hypothetical protein
MWCGLAREGLSLLYAARELPYPKGPPDLPAPTSMLGRVFGAGLRERIRGFIEELV